MKIVLIGKENRKMVVLAILLSFECTYKFATTTTTNASRTEVQAQTQDSKQTPLKN